MKLIQCIDILDSVICICDQQANGIRTAALVPYADMLNHLRPRETKWQFEDSVQV